MFPKIIIEKLQAVRARTFIDYQKITLDRDALKIVSHLFFNPECQSDIDLITLPGKIIKLKDLGEHIITAGPSTLAKFANNHNIKHLTKADLLKCFALDHARDVKDNKVIENKNAFYALAHILNVSQVVKIYPLANSKACRLEIKTIWGSIIFKHVIIVPNLDIKIGEFVYHHFGVVVAKVEDKKLAKEIVSLQKGDEFTSKLFRQTGQKDVVIDFSLPNIFHKDVTGQIMHPEKVKQVKHPGDIVKKQIKFKN